MSPLIEPRIVTRWEDPSQGLLVLSLELKNRAKFRVMKEEVLFQSLEYDIPQSGELTEWLPFSKNRILQTEPPRQWREPSKIMQSTQWLEPEETVVVERLYKCPRDTALHFGVQFKASPKTVWSRIAGDPPWSGQWTSTGFAYCRPDHDQNVKSSMKEP